MKPKRIVLRLHAQRRMFARGIKTMDVEAVLDAGETIEEYPADTPYPSRLVLGWVRGRPLHVVVADDHEEYEMIVVTAYEPDPAQWDDGFRRRKL